MAECVNSSISADVAAVAVAAVVEDVFFIKSRPLDDMVLVLVTVLPTIMSIISSSPLEEEEEEDDDDDDDDDDCASSVLPAKMTSRNGDTLPSLSLDADDGGVGGRMKLPVEQSATIIFSYC